METVLIKLLFRVPAILIALTVHEFAHGWTARRLGDNTAERMGRLTLNPLAHLDLFGTLMLLFGPFGWAKPVPVNPRNLRNPRRDMVWVAIAGPLSNICFGFAVAWIYTSLYTDGAAGVGRYFFLYLIMINIGLSFFNLLPVPPLDGSNIVRGFLSPENDLKFLHAMRFAPFIFIGLISLEWLFKIPALSYILDPLWEPYLNALLALYGLSGLGGF